MPPAISSSLDATRLAAAAASTSVASFAAGIHGPTFSVKTFHASKPKGTKCASSVSEFTAGTLIVADTSS
eukprot:5391665-Pyramimonas_sp.AAC.1